MSRTQAGPELPCLGQGARRGSLGDEGAWEMGLFSWPGLWF